MTSKSENLIVWQKWFDPLGEDDLDQMQVIESATEPEFYTEEDDEEEGENIDVVEEEEFYKRPTKVIMTPMGIIPYTENTASNKIFNFWVGHTNFNLNLPVCKLIEDAEGVETLDVFTRYRFRIGVGKLFDDKSIMRDINETVYSFLDQ
jgi:hypothetical protein